MGKTLRIWNEFGETPVSYTHLIWYASDADQKLDPEE